MDALALVIRIAGVVAFTWFVFYWASLFSKRIEPFLRRHVSQRFDIEIIRRQTGPSYHWVTPDKQPRSRVMVFFWCALLFLTIGSGPMIVALLGVGLLVHAISG